MKTENNIVYPSDLIDILYQLEEHLKSGGYHMLDRPNTDYISDFTDMCYRYIPTFKTDLTSKQHKVILYNGYINDTNVNMNDSQYITSEDENWQIA